MCHSPSHFFPAGRIVRRLLSVLSLALPAAAQTTFEVREISNPPGLITARTTLVAAGASHRVRDFPVVAGTHRFGFWTFNGIRQSFPNGQAFIYPEAVVTEAIEAVAHYFPEAQDGDGDRLPDWWEYWMFGTRDRGPQDDDDGDGVRHEEEFQSGYSAAFRDGIPVGGVSARLSAPLRLIQRNRWTYSLRSAPLGLVMTDGELAPGQSYTTPHLTGDIAGYTFVGFEVDGQPVRDVTGYCLNQITVTPTANSRIVARYVPAGADSDGDQIEDSVEFQHFGGLQYNRTDDPDQDGLTIGEELAQGLSLITADAAVDGGISTRLSAPLNYDRVRIPYVMESRPLGLLTQVNEMVASGTARTSPHVGTDQVSGFVFGYWSVNGVRIAAPDGLARRQIQVTVNSPTTLVAHFFDPAADSDGDGLQDAWEWTTFGSLANDKASDPDNDDLTIAQEQNQGLSAAHEDMAVSGGLSTRLSAPLNYETGTRKRLLVRSRPLGIAATTEQYLPVNASVTSTRYDFNDRYSDHYFTHWTRNGTRVSDATGHARAQVVLPLSEDTELVANFTQPGDDRDADGIPDYLELRMAGNLAVIGPEADLDDDGFTCNQERGMGYSHLLQDQLRDGGVSVRLSAPATLKFEEPPMNLLPAQLVAVRGAAAGSLVAALAISPIPPSRTYQFNLVLGDGDRDNSRFSLAGNELRLTAPLDAAGPRFLNARISATDDLGIQRFYQVVVQVLEVPLITLQPADVFADKGGPATFRVLATGSAPLNYQWQFNEEDLPGETSSVLRLSNITPANRGSYRAVVSSRSGSATSDPALLTVFTDLATWAAGYGLTGADVSATATPASDGINNLLKYAFNLNPIQSDVRVLTAGTGNAGLPLITWGEGGALRFEFLRRKGAGLTYTPQLSGSVAAGTWQPAAAIPTITNVDAEWERVVVVEPLPAEMKTRVFARLLVTQTAGS
jgi:hypothetical protein